MKIRSKQEEVRKMRVGFGQDGGDCGESDSSQMFKRKTGYHLKGSQSRYRVKP